MKGLPEWYWWAVCLIPYPVGLVMAAATFKASQGLIIFFIIMAPIASMIVDALRSDLRQQEQGARRQRS